MRKAWAVFVGLILCGTGLAAFAADLVTVEHDRFKGTTTFRYKGSEPAQRPKSSRYFQPLTMHAYVTIEEGTGRPPESFMLLATWAREWRYLRCNATHWLADGRPFEFGASRHEGSVGRGGVTEIIVVPASLPQMAAAGQAGSLELQICNDEMAFRSQDIAGLRELAARATAHLGAGSQREPAGSVGSVEPPTQTTSYTGPPETAAKQFLDSYRCSSGFRQVVADGDRYVYEATCPSGAVMKAECWTGICRSIQ